MPEQLKQILDKILEWWKKFNNRQRVMIASAIGVVIIALVILAFVMSTPSLTTLYICNDYSEAAAIKEILDTDGTITYETVDGGLVYLVAKEDEAAACMLLATNEFASQVYSIDNVLDGGFTATEADKQKKYKLYLEEKFASHIMQFSNVISCTVDLDLPEKDGTILSRNEQASASIYLKLSKDISDDQAYALAQLVATGLGNDSTENIVILDSEMRLLYSGADSESSIGVASTQLSYREKVKSLAEEDIKQLLVNSKLFANVEVAMNMVVNFDSTVIQKKELGIPSGMTGGAITSQSLYDYESTSGIAGGVPGTDTNDDTTYVFQDSESVYTVIAESDTDYSYDEIVTTITNNGGNVEYDESSISVVATRYVKYDEALLRASGQLDDMTFEEFKATHSGTNVTSADDLYVQIIADATGFSASKITFVCYEEPLFIEEAGNGRTITDYAQIIIAVLIFVLLGYVVFRSTRKQKEEEIEPELSVETLLESTSTTHESLEDIGYNEKSDVRVMIEKFVDENPEAVAQLLRNWLNEDWE